jgi:hypothetical protein
LRDDVSEVAVGALAFARLPLALDADLIVACLQKKNQLYNISTTQAKHHEHKTQ